jgi:hypothetical protein
VGLPLSTREPAKSGHRFEAGRFEIFDELPGRDLAPASRGQGPQVGVQAGQHRLAGRLVAGPGELDRARPQGGQGRALPAGRGQLAGGDRGGGPRQLGPGVAGVAPELIDRPGRRGRAGQLGDRRRAGLVAGGLGRRRQLLAHGDELRERRAVERDARVGGHPSTGSPRLRNIVRYCSARRAITRR